MLVNYVRDDLVSGLFCSPTNKSLVESPLERVLSHNQIKSIDSEHFGNEYYWQTNLIALWLDDNLLQWIPSEVFSEFSSLQYLWVFHYFVSNGDNQSFSPIAITIYANIDLIVEIFSFLFCLSKISIFNSNLAFNRINRLEPKSFIGLRNLLKL